jgi:hypothetical protein
VITTGPTTRATLTLFQLFLRTANSSLARNFLLGIVNPANELIASQWRNVDPGFECGRVRDERTS